MRAKELRGCSVGDGAGQRRPPPAGLSRDFPGSTEPCAENSARHEDFGVTGAGVDPHQQPTESENSKIASWIRVVLFIRVGERMRCGQLYGGLLQDAAQ